MINMYYLIVGSQEYQIVPDENSGIYDEIFNKTPILGEGVNIGGEIYFMVNIDIPFNENVREKFDIGDLIYWRSPENNIFCIAVFYGNTSHGSGDAPIAASEAIKFSSIMGNCDELESIQTGMKIELV